MKYKPGETLEEWSKRVQLYEYGLALQELANGKDTNQVMEAMAKRITDKMMHPLLVTMNSKDLSESEKEALEVGRMRYQHEYIDRFEAKPDHILDDVAKIQQTSK